MTKYGDVSTSYCTHISFTVANPMYQIWELFSGHLPKYCTEKHIELVGWLRMHFLGNLCADGVKWTFWLLIYFWFINIILVQIMFLEKHCWKQKLLLSLKSAVYAYATNRYCYYLPYLMPSKDPMTYGGGTCLDSQH